MRHRPAWRRKAVNQAVEGISALVALIGCFLLAWILWVVIREGCQAFSWRIFTEKTPPPVGDTETGPSGGLANAIVGHLLIVGLATLLAIPMGFMAGLYLAEFGRHSWVATVVRFGANVLFGVPSIIIGLFIYVLLVVPHGGTGAPGYTGGYAGAYALAFIMLPIVARTAEDMLRLVPDTLREAAMAMGAARWRTALIAARAARTGILTGTLLAIARVGGETAPLIFTAGFSQFPLDFRSAGALGESFASPTPNLTVTMYQFAMSPYPNWIALGWAGALLVTVGVLLLTVVARLLLYWRTK
jgi:phosphate transport system permease protein